MPEWAEGTAGPGLPVYRSWCPECVRRGTRCLECLRAEDQPDAARITAEMAQERPGARHADMPGGGFHAVFAPDRVVLVHQHGARVGMIVMSPSDWERLVKWAPKLRGLAT